MRRVLAALAALMVAAPAWATTFVVTNDTQRNTAVTTAVAGDLIDVRAGTYTGTFVPTNSGTAGSYITIKGAIGTDSVGTRVCTTGLSWTAGQTRSYISWKGLNLSGDVQFTRADHCSLTYCKVDSGGLMSFGSNSDPTSAGISSNNYVGQSTFRQKIQNTWYLIGFKRTETTTVERCRFYVTITNASADAKGRYFYRCSNNTFKDCALFAECWGAENGEQFIQGIRDSSSNNTFLRDTIWVGLTSKRSRRVLFSQAGTYSGSTVNNAWINGDYRSFQETATDICFEFQDHTNAVVQNTLFAARTGSAFQMCSPTTNGVQIRNCTFYSGGQQALNSADTVLPTSTTHLKGCAFLTRGTGGCASNTTQTFFLQTLGAFGQSDSNYFATADTTNTFRKSGGGAVCYTPGAWRTASGNDIASRSYLLVGTAVEDTTWATLNLRPKTGSTMLSSQFPSGYAGAYYVAGNTPADPPPPPPPAVPKITGGGWSSDDGLLRRRR